MTIAVRPSSRHVERALDPGLGAQVEVRRRLVEDQHARLRQEGAGEREQLALARRERDAALVARRVEARGEPLDEVVEADGVGTPRGPPRRSRRAGRRRRCRGSSRGTGTAPGARRRAGVRSDSSVTSRRSWPSMQHRAPLRVVEAGDAAWRSSTCPRRSGRRARRSRPAAMRRSTSASTGRAPVVAERDVARARSRRRSAAARTASGVLADARGLRAEQLAQLRDRGLPLLVGVVELDQLLDRREERGRGRARTRSARRA